jgi:hypothetical protein
MARIVSYLTRTSIGGSIEFIECVEKQLDRGASICVQSHLCMAGPPAFRKKRCHACDRCAMEGCAGSVTFTVAFY